MKSFSKIIVLFTFFSLNQAVINGQSRTCVPMIDLDYCSDPCMEVESITNNTPCALNFWWIYQGTTCNMNIGAGTVPANSSIATPATPWVGPCMKICDDPCQCPIGFWLEDPNNPLNFLDPWGANWTSVGSQVTYYNLSSCCPITALNPTGEMKATFTVTGSKKATIVFSCMP